MSQAVSPEVSPTTPRRERAFPADFKDRLTCPIPDFREVMSVAWHGGFRPDIGDADQIPVLRAGLPAVATVDAGITWVGHATYVLRIGGLTVLTDPVWSRKIPGTPAAADPAWRRLERPAPRGRRGHQPQPLRPPGRPDHPAPAAAHAGVRPGQPRQLVHQDAGSRTSPSSTGGRAPGSAGRLRLRPRPPLEPRHHHRHLQVAVGRLGAHRSAASASTSPGTPAYGDWFSPIGRRHPGIDLALMPIGAYEPRWLLQRRALDPDEAVQACRTWAPAGWRPCTGGRSSCPASR